MEPQKLGIRRIGPKEVADALARKHGWPRIDPLRIEPKPPELALGPSGQAMVHESHVPARRLRDEDITQGPIVPSSGSMGPRSLLGKVILTSLAVAAFLMGGLVVKLNCNENPIPTVSNTAEVHMSAPHTEPNQTPTRASRFTARSMEDVIFFTMNRTTVSKVVTAYLSQYGGDSKSFEPVELSEQELATVRAQSIGEWILDISKTEMPFVVLTPEMRLVCNPKGAGGCHIPGTNIIFISERKLTTIVHEFVHNAYDLNNRGFVYLAPSDRKLKFTWIPENLFEGATELTARRATGVNDPAAYASYTRSALMLEAIDFTEFYMAFMYGDWTKFQQKVDVLFGKNTFQNILELAELGATNDGYLGNNEDASASCALNRYLISKFSESKEGRKMLAQIKIDPLWNATFEPKCNGK